ncbi:hypothetical protein AB7C87_12390 [Natrarchaeobius sp. A-rgal3]|uniref:DUF7551 domain-containing protein n=1 Tax=Natrarchaeobius versutus TaxID=1679078 RepID=UPI00350F0367
MTGPTLCAIREVVAALATTGDRYSIVCGRTGIRPVPAERTSFGSKAAARVAAWATERYRATVAQYDPYAPQYDVIVSERPVCGSGPKNSDRSTVEGSDATRPGPNRSQIGGDASALVEYCHAVGGGALEAAAPYDGLTETIMEAYFDRAGTVPNAETLCVCLLESIAFELDARLDFDDRASVLAAAAAGTSTATPNHVADDPLEEALWTIRSVGLLEHAAIERRRVDEETGERSWTIKVGGGPLEGPTDRSVALPIVFECSATLPRRSVSVTSIERVGDSTATPWRLRLRTTAATTRRDRRRTRGETA